MHPWTSRTEPNPDAIGKPTIYTGSEEQIEESILNYPDYMLFDIDPYIYSGKESKGAEPEYNKKAFDKGREIAFKVKELLDSLKLKSFIKTSGKTGLHIYVPILRDFTYTQTRSAGQTLSSAVLAAHPKEVTLERSFLVFKMSFHGSPVSFRISGTVLISKSSGQMSGSFSQETGMDTGAPSTARGE